MNPNTGDRKSRCGRRARAGRIERVPTSGAWRRATALVVLWGLILGTGSGLGRLNGDAATNALPAPAELLELLRAHLAGWKPEAFDQAASEALLQRFEGKVIPAGGDPMKAEVPDTGPVLSRTNRFEGGVAYLQVARVNAELVGALSGALADTNLLADSRGLVLDLRFAGGGDFSVAAPVVSMLSRRHGGVLDWGDGHAEIVPPTNGVRVPLVILVNSRTSGAAEAVAHVLRQSASAVVLGGRTAGRLAVNRNISLPDGRSLRVPLGLLKLGDEVLPASGVVPDIAVTSRTESERQWMVDPYASGLPTNAPAGMRLGAGGGRRRTTEADLVRARRESNSPGVTAPPSGGGGDRGALIQDPVLARAIDLVKAVELLAKP